MMQLRRPEDLVVAPGIITGVLVIGAVVVGGCSRAHYRQRADRQAYEILAEKDCDPRWTIPRVDITPDPRSRFFDPADPDCPPLPMDDPAAHQYMECVYGMRGSKRWACLGEIDYLENPRWTSFLKGADAADDGSLPVIGNLTLVDAVELSLIHSRDYQTQLENLYLAALSVTFQRYRFDVRPIGFLGEPGTGLFYQHDGPEDQTGLNLGPTNLGISKLFPTGAQLVAELTNNTLWMFSGGNGTGTATTLAFSLVQPLLGRAGREIALEDLTQAERNVVYAMRDFARFRKQFFVNTITGGQVAGLQRFLRGFEFLANTGETPSVGFFPLLLRLQQLRNLEMIVRTLEFLIEESRASGAGPLDIARMESSLAYYRSDLISETRPFLDRVDQYKVQLGLPPGVEISLDDSLLEPFQFVESSVVEVENRLRVFGREVRELQLPAEPQRIQELLADLEGLGRQVAAALALLENDFGRLDLVLPESLGRLDDAGRRQLEEILDEERTRFAEVRSRFEQTSEELETLKRQFAGQSVPSDRQKALAKSMAGLRNDLLTTVRRASIIQITVRVELIPIQPVDLDMTEAVQVALENRLDLMNRQASVVDARRQLEIVADALESNLDLVAEGEVRTPPLMGTARPFEFRAGESEFRVGLGLTTPLDRRAERNNFRASQIAYQQARRGYMAAEDQVVLEVRQGVRTLEELSQTIVQSRRRVQFSARELDLAETQAGLAQRGLSLTTALRGLNRAQDELIEFWLDYETTRLNVFRDIGTMQIDERGFWPDPFYLQMIERDTQ